MTPIARLDPETSSLFGPLASAVAAYGNNVMTSDNHHRRSAALKGVAKDTAYHSEEETAELLFMIEENEPSETVKGKAG